MPSRANSSVAQLQNLLKRLPNTGIGTLEEREEVATALEPLAELVIARCAGFKAGADNAGNMRTGNVVVEDVGLPEYVAVEMPRILGGEHAGAVGRPEKSRTG